MPFHERSQRWAVLVVHRRGGKTVAVINDLIKRALECTRDSPRYAYIAPTYSQAKDVAWAYLKFYTRRISGVIVRETELSITLPGDRRIRLYGADNYDRMRGIYLDGAVIDESADMAAAAWTEVINPALSDRQGWAVWIGTPKGKDQFYALYRHALTHTGEYYSLLLPASRSRYLPANELAAQRSSPGMTQAIYDQEFECSFDAPIPGSIYGQFMSAAHSEGRVSGDVLHYSQCPVYTAWDLGAPQNTWCWIFQAVRDRINFLEALQGGDSCATPRDWAVRLKAKPYNYGGHFVPHDGGNAVNYNGHHGEATWQQLFGEAGLSGVVVMARVANVWDNINDAISSFNRCYFNVGQCAGGIEALEAYHYKQEDDGRTLKDVPVHDWASHPSTAFGYVHQAIRLGLLVDRSAMPGRPTLGDPRQRQSILAGWGKTHEQLAVGARRSITI